MLLSTGKISKACFSTTTIANMTTLSFAVDSPLLEEAVFGTDWSTVAGQGIKSCNGSMSGLVDTEDSTGQTPLLGAVVSGTKITDFRLYITDADYWTSDTVSFPSAGCYFSNYAPSAEANGITKFSVDFKFHGPVHLTS